MNPLFRALLLLIPTAGLFVYSLILFFRRTTFSVFMQLVGAGFLVIVVLTHICEALSLFSFMQWGSPHGAGHYLDLGSAFLGLILFPAGFLLRFSKRRNTNKGVE